MKKMIAGLFAGLILATGAQVLAYGCENGACELPQRQNTSYCYGDDAGYCYDDDAGYCYDGDAGYCYDGDRTPTARNERTYQGRGGCGCYRGR